MSQQHVEIRHSGLYWTSSFTFRGSCFPFCNVAPQWWRERFYLLKSIIAPVCCLLLDFFSCSTVQWNVSKCSYLDLPYYLLQNSTSSERRSWIGIRPLHVKPLRWLCNCVLLYFMFSSWYGRCTFLQKLVFVDLFYVSVSSLLPWVGSCGRICIVIEYYGIFWLCQCFAQSGWASQEFFINRFTSCFSDYAHRYCKRWSGHKNIVSC